MSLTPQRARTAAGWRAPLVRRVHVAMALIAVALAGVLLKAARLQLVLGDDLRGLAEEQYLRNATVTGPRGDIVDRVGRPLAVSVPAWSVAARPPAIADKPGAAAVLAPLLEKSPAEVAKKLGGDAKFVWLARRISREAADAVRALDVPGVELRQETRRFYPQKTLLGQALGGLDVDGKARGGVEQSLDAELRGRSQKAQQLLDNHGDRLALDGDLDVRALEGDTVVLTIDAQLQHVAEEAVLEALREHQAKAAWAVVLDARTAEVLALANAPAFNPNTPGADRESQKNKSIAEVFEPGSIFKMATFAAALDAGAVKLDERIYCENGAMKLGKHVIHDTHKAEWLTATEVFQQSSNIGTLKIAQNLGEERFRAALERYGFAARPGTGLLDEAGGRLPKEARWGEARLATVSFGHGVLVSALQIASFAQAIANDGEQVAPSIVRGVRSSTGEPVRGESASTTTRLFSERTARDLTTAMKSVAHAGGTGTLAAIPGIEVAGKTGTAEKVDPITKRYSSDLHLSSFVGFAPADAPEVVAIVVLDEPRGQAFGGMVAAPAWRRIVEAALVERGVLASGHLAPFTPAPPAGEEPPVAVLGERAAGARAPGAAGTAGAASADVEGVVPDLRGLGARAALVLAGDAGWDLSLSGSGVVVTQDPAPGKKAPGGVVRVVLAEGGG